MVAKYQKMMRKVFLIAVTAALLLVSCDENKTRFYDASIERSDSASVKVERFDRDIFTMTPDLLESKYQGFLPIYVHGVLHLDSISQLSRFTSDSGVLELSEYTQRVYDKSSRVEHQLDVAFKYYHHYFPNKEVPRVLFHISGFNQAIVVADGFLSGSIDEYLGSDFEHYEGIAYSYELPYMTPSFLPLDMMKGWLTATFAESLQGDRLIDQMLFYGKITYLMRVFFPDVSKYDIMQYSTSQYKWCEKYEKEVWAHLMENRDLFSTDWRVATKYISPAPFTSGFSQESPGRIGVYIGFKIVESYMNANADATLQTLMDFTDSQRFLQEARYRP